MTYILPFQTLLGLTGIGLAFLVCIAAWLTDGGDGDGNDDGATTGNNAVVPSTSSGVGVTTSGRVCRWKGSIAHGIHANGSMVTNDEWTRRFHALAVSTPTTITPPNTTPPTTTIAGVISQTVATIKPMPSSRICVADAEQLLDDFIIALHINY